MLHLARYLVASMIGSIILVMSVLMVLGGLFTFIAEQDGIGTGRYDVWQALIYSAMNLPRFALDALPAGTLIGALLGMGTLARNNEIVAMRAAGMSKSRMVVAALGGGMLVVALALLVGEYLAPGLEQLADQRKALAKYNDISFAVRGGAWLRDGNRIINVDSQSGALRFGGLTVFELGEGATLASVGHATHANNPGTGEWQLSDYRETRFERERVLSTRQASTTFATPNSGGFTQLAVVQPRQMSLTSLRMAIEYTHSNTLSASGYEFEFWSRMARTLALWVAMVFAVPFGFGLLRAAGTGARAALGLGIGLLYFFLQQIVGSAATLFALNPLMLAWVPTMLLIGAASFLLWRAR